MRRLHWPVIQQIRLFLLTANKTLFATTMTDFAALTLAQPPLPPTLSLDASLYNNIFSGRSSNGGPSLPQFSAATLQFLQKLSPSLQRAALTTLLKPKNRKTDTPVAADADEDYDPISHQSKTAERRPTPPRESATTTTAITTSTLPPTTTKTTTTTARPTTSSTTQSRKPPSTTAYFRTPPAFHWTDDENGDVSSMTWGNDFSKEASSNSYRRNAVDNVNRMGLPSSGNSGDAGIVLLVAIFNLLAVVIYAAHRHVTNIPSLPPRVLDWQIQKVLDELVLRVHSSRGAAQMLARALPDGMSPSSTQFSGRSSSGGGLTSENSLLILEKAKGLLIQVAASPTASSTASLPIGIYRPLTHLYSTVFDDLQNFLADGGNLANLGDNAFEGRSLNGNGVSSAPTWLQIAHGASQLNGIQWDGVLRTLTILGRSRSFASSEAIAGALMKALISPEGTGRKFNAFNIHALTDAAFGTNRNSSIGPIERNETTTDQPSTMANETGSALTSARVMRRMGFVEDASGLTGAGGEVGGDHWAQRWFSLVTRLAPVALDATTLYARAHSEPTCLRSLLCSINFSWKKVGPLQAALTPLLSVLTGWALEDRAPHPLGESLAAIRGGWLGRDCQAMYPECSIDSTAGGVVSQALTYFSRLEISVNENSQQKSKPSHRQDYDSNVIFSDNSNRPMDQNQASSSNERLQQATQLSLSDGQEEYQSQPHHPNQGISRYDEIASSQVNHHENLRKGQQDDSSEGHFDTSYMTSRDPSDELDYSHRNAATNNIHSTRAAEQDDHSSTTMRYEDHQDYEARNPHDSYELYRKEVYGTFVPDSEVEDSDVSKHGTLNGREDLIMNHKMAENEIDPGRHDYHVHLPRGEDDTSSLHSTSAWDTGYQKRQGEEHLSSPPYERYDSPITADEEAPLENHSVITGMDLQDLPKAGARAEPLMSEEEQGEQGGADDGKRNPPEQSSNQLHKHQYQQQQEQDHHQQQGHHYHHQQEQQHHHYLQRHNPKQPPQQQQQRHQQQQHQYSPDRSKYRLPQLETNEPHSSPPVHHQLQEKEVHPNYFHQQSPHERMKQPIDVSNKHQNSFQKLYNRPPSRRPSKLPDRSHQQDLYQPPHPQQHDQNEHDFSYQRPQSTKEPSHREYQKPQAIDRAQVQKEQQFSRQQYKRPSYPVSSSEPKIELPTSRPQVPKSRILLHQSSTGMKQVAQRRKQLWAQDESSPYRRISIMTLPDTKKTTLISNNLGKYNPMRTAYQRRNSKMPTKTRPPLDTLRNSPGSVHSDKLEIPLYANFQNDHHSQESQGTNIPSDIPSIQSSSHKRGNARPKYKYGLRRGLPAVTVENFSKSKQGTESTSHLSKRTRPWYTYNSSETRRSKYAHKNTNKRRTTVTPPYEKAVEEFGPADAVTDELRNNLLYEYIRDQKKDATEAPEATTTEITEELSTQKLQQVTEDNIP